MTVSGSTGADGSYATLGAAFTAINGGAQTGNVIAVSIDNSTDEGTATAALTDGGWTSLTITPNGARSVSGATTAGNPLINLNGAKNVTIDGINSGGNSLSIVNTTVGSGSTIRFIADASSNMVTNCTIAGSETSTTSGTIFFSTGTTTGNIGNTISGNTITQSGGSLPTNAIYSAGTSAAIFNSGTISGNNIQDFFNAALVSVGINLSSTGNSAWTITNNKLFQTATRIYTTGNTHSGINIGTGSGYTVAGNTIGFADANGNGTTNMVGNTVALTGTFPTSYTTTGTANATRYIAINCAFTAAGAASSIQNNTIGGFALYTSSGASTTNGVWCGINVTSGNANIGTTTKNIIGAEAGNGSIYTAATTTGGTAVGIFATSTNTVNIQNNTIGAVDAVGTTATLSGGFTGIDTAGAAGVFTINSNIIGNTTADNIRTGYTTTTGVSGGPLTNAGILTSTTGATGAQVGIRNTATGTTLSINSNTLRGWAVGGTVTAVTGITNTGAITTTVTNNSNLLGTAARGWVRYAFANSGALIGINRATAPGAAATLAINSNDFRGIVNSVAGTHSHTYVTWTHGNSVADNVNSNTFTNLSISTTGAVIFFNRGTTSMTSTGSLSVSSNSIVTGFTNASASATTVYTNSTGASSPNGATILMNLNNFSNVTLTGVSAFTGIDERDGPGGGSGPTKTISNNTFNAITTGAAQITGISHNFSGNGSTVTGNTLSNLTTSGGSGGVILAISAGASISGATSTISSNTLTNFTATGQVNAIQTALGAALTTGNINNNTVTNISTSGAANPVFCIIDSGFGATTTNVFKNKIGNIQSDNAGGSVFGILVQTGSTTQNVYNNLVGDLRAPSSTAAGSNQIQGISVGSGPTNVNLFYNTVWLNNTINTGAIFGSSAVSVNVTPTVVMEDNIFVNRSVNNGGALTVAHRRTGTSLATYGAASNNNDFYAGTPGATNLIFNDGTNSDQTIAAYKIRVASRDSASFSENPTFLSTTAAAGDAPTDANFLHIDPTVATQTESGGTPITSPINITDDFDGDTRNASTPDVGGDEFNGIAIDLTPPNISYTPLANTNLLTNRTLTTTIADATGVPTSGVGLPVLYYRKGVSDPFVSSQGSFVSGNTYNFLIDYSQVTGGSVTAGDTIQYYIVAQDTVTPTPNIGAFPSGGASGFSADPPAVSTPPTAPSSYTILASISGNFNVGAGGGNDYASLTAAIADLNSKVLNGSVVFNLVDASYTLPPDAPSAESFPITINANSGSSSMNTVTIKPASGQNVTITGSLAASALFILNGADWIIIDGSNDGSSSRNLTLTATNTSTSSAVVWLQSNGADGATNNTIKNVNLVGNGNTQTLFGVGSGSSTISITSAGTGNNSNTFQNCNISKTQYGIYSGGLSAASKNTGNAITGNLINAVSPNNVAIGGILVNFESGITISQNNIAHISSATTPAFGITLGLRPSNIFTGFTGNETAGATISQNVIDDIVRAGDGTSFGIGVAPVTSVGAAANTIVNNMISRVRATSATPSDFPAGILLAGGATSSTKVYHNSVSMTGAGATTSPTLAIVVSGANPVVDLRNNIFYNTQTTSTGKTYAIGLTYSSPYTNLTSDYNDFFSSGTTANFAVTGGLTGTDRTSLAAWRTETGKDANSISIPPADPGFVSTSDLHLSSNASPAANACLPIAGITTDIDGNSRSAIKPDIGADEIASNKLSSLVPGMGMLNEPFLPDTTSYTQDVSNAINSITFTPTEQDSNAAITVNGNMVASGSPSDPIPLNVGMNTVTVVVTPEFGPFAAGDAPDAGTPKTYTVVVTRAQSANADLSDLTLSAGAFSPPFDPATTSYTLGVSNATASTTVTPTAAEPNATIQVRVNGGMYSTVASGGTSSALALDVGMNTVDVKVTAQDTTTMKIYTVTVTRAPSSNANLSNLVLSDGTLVPAFDPSTTSYAASVLNSTSSITVTPTVQDPTATVTVNGTPVASGMPSDPISLAVGSNMISVVVSAQDEMGIRTPQTTKTYTVDVTRAVAVSSNANLSDLVLSAGAIMPVFDPDTISYSLTVPNATTSTTVTPTAQDAGATTEVNGNPVVSGNASDPIALVVGDNVITTVVTAADTTTMKTYTVTVHRTGPVTTNSGSGLAPDYASLAAAITALNAATITDPVEITLHGNETAPAGGYVITQQGGTGVNAILIQGDMSTVTASAALVAGNLNDAIFKLIGANWVTLQNFTMQENPANTTTATGTNNMTEWGAALLHASVTQGCQNNTIQNNTISLNKIYGNTFGVYSNNRHSAAVVTVAEEVTNNTTGPASGNKVYNNAISNVNHGIVFIGSATAANMDVGNDIGGPVVIDSPAVATGNAVSNYGGLPAATAFVGYPTTIVGGAYLLDQNNFNLSNNSFISASLNTATALRGILTDYVAVPVGTITDNILNNTVTFTQAGAGGMQAITTASTAGAIANVTMNMTGNKFINSAVTGASSAVTMFGVANLGAYGTLNMNNNTVSGNTSTATTGGFIGGTNQGAVVNTINIMGNDIGTEASGAVTFSTATSGGITGISNTTGAATTTLNITGNFFRGFSLVSSGQLAAVINSGAPIGVAVNLNNNHIGTATSNFATYSAASAGNFFGVVNAAGAAAASLSISGNDIRGTVQNVVGSGGLNYINNQVFTGATAINNNTFTNIVANSTATAVLISNSVAHAANTVHTVNNNSIVGTFNRTAVSGALQLFLSNSTSPATVTETSNGNNFSNISLAGTSSLNPWQNSDGGSPVTNVTNNTFSNITGGSGAMTVLNVGFSSNGTVTGNTISNVTGGGAITGITSTSGTQTFSSNTVTGLASTGASAVTGISVTGGSSQSLSKNKVYDLSGNNAGTTVNGILVSGGTTVAAFNNLIGDLRAPNTSSATDAIRGINLTSTTSSSNINLSYNTIYLSATMGGANFSSSGIFHTTSATATTAALNLRNNVVVNNSIANGTGVAAAYRRNNATLANYGATSNNNDFYAGAPSASHVIFFDGTNSDQTIQAYRARVASRDSASFTENPPFLSTTGSDPTFLHCDPAMATHLESMAANVSGISDDYDGDIRQGNPGYAGTGTAPDVGADEFGGMALAFNADLSNLILSDGMLSPDFDPATTIYTAMVPNSTTSITETPTAADSTSTITVNGNPVVSGTPSGSIPLVVGPNVVTTVVTAQDGTTMKTYTVTVTRAASANADLSNLTLSAAALNEMFDPSVTSYTASVPNATTSTTLTPTAADAGATITVNGDPVSSGMASAPIPLNVGMNTITTVVTAPAGNMKTYTVVVTRAPSSNANLSNLTLSSGMLVPAFDPDTTDYTASVGHKIISITVTPTVDDPTATVTVNGDPVPSGVASGPIALAVGNNTVTIIVSAQDEMAPNAPMTTKTYTVVVNRAPVPVVSNTNDSGAGSLRGALDDVLDGETINFALSFVRSGAAPAVAVINLTGGELVINNSVTINGPGADVVTVTRSGTNFRIFHVMPGHTVTIGGLTIDNGNVTGGSYPNGVGGGIYNDHSDLTLTNCALTGNHADYGGGLFNDGISSTGSAQIAGCTFSGNEAGLGGGIFSSGEGGAVTMSINNSTLSGNNGLGDVGAIYNDASSGGSSAALQISNSTLSGNTGGTISGIANDTSGGSTGSVDIGNTILKKGASGVNLVNLGPGTITSHGYNLSDDAGGGFLTATGDQINTDPMLGPLQNNGGPTKTHAPLVNSPALDQGKRSAILPLSTNVDQRGSVRPVDDPAVANAAGGDASDIGAVELAADEIVHPTSAASRKTHGAAGDFNVDLPLTGALGIECRSGGATNAYKVIVNFTNINSVNDVQIVSGTGVVDSFMITAAGESGGSQLTINLSGVTDIQTLTLGLFDVDDGSSISDVGVRMRVRIGDVMPNDMVNSSDVSAVKSEVGHVVSGANFRTDVNANGEVNASDVSLTKSKIP